MPRSIAAAPSAETRTLAAAVIDLASRTLEHLIDVGAPVARHSVMIDAYGTLWSTRELNDLVIAIDPRSDKVERVDLGGSPHPIAISHATGKRSLRSRPKASSRWSIRKRAA
jgi:DNA-binding beta-propeller fold protein YncE